MGHLERSIERHHAQKREKIDLHQKRTTKLRLLDEFRHEIENGVGKLNELKKRDGKVGREEDSHKVEAGKFGELKSRLETVEEAAVGINREITELTAEQEQSRILFAK